MWRVVVLAGLVACGGTTAPRPVAAPLAASPPPLVADPVPSPPAAPPAGAETTASAPATPAELHRLVDAARELDERGDHAGAEATLRTALALAQHGFELPAGTELGDDTLAQEVTVPPSRLLVSLVLDALGGLLRAQHDDAALAALPVDLFARGAAMAELDPRPRKAPSLGVRLRGPFASLAAYCAIVAREHDAFPDEVPRCDGDGDGDPAVARAARLRTPAPFRHLALVPAAALDDSYEIALATAAGWYVTERGFYRGSARARADVEVTVRRVHVLRQRPALLAVEVHTTVDAYDDRLGAPDGTIDERRDEQLRCAIAGGVPACTLIP